MYVCMYACMYVCMYVRMYVRTYVCVCMCVYVCMAEEPIHTYLYITVHDYMYTGYQQCCLWGLSSDHRTPYHTIYS